MKKANRAVAPSKLGLKKQPLRVLNDDVPKNIAGGGLPPTHNTACGTQCLPSEYAAGEP